MTHSGSTASIKLSELALFAPWCGEVRLTIERLLDRELPEAYDESIYNTKCDAAYRHVYDAYYGGGESLYAATA